MITVTEIEAGGDRAWFTDNPYRRYRLRGEPGNWWIIRRRTGDVLLRTACTSVPPGPIEHCDKALRRAWIDSAWRELNPAQREELLKEIKRGEKLCEL
jgi:hypothetical protein